MWDWLCNLWNDLWWNEESPNHIVFGQSYNIHRTFKGGNLALLIAIIALIIAIINCF
jgi:hypothetical protein